MVILDKLYDWANDQCQYTLIHELFYNALFFNTAAAAGIAGIKIRRESNSGFKETIPNYFAISFGSQGLGKNHSFDLAEYLFKEMYNSYIAHAEAFYNKHYDSKNDKCDLRYIGISSPFIPVNSSWQGIQKTAQTVCDQNFGSVNIISDEIADEITGMSEILKMMKTA